MRGRRGSLGQYASVGERVVCKVPSSVVIAYDGMRYNQFTDVCISVSLESVHVEGRCERHKRWRLGNNFRASPS